MIKRWREIESIICSKNVVIRPLTTTLGILIMNRLFRRQLPLDDSHFGTLTGDTEVISSVAQLFLSTDGKTSLSLFISGAWLSWHP